MRRGLFPIYSPTYRGQGPQAPLRIFTEPFFIILAQSVVIAIVTEAAVRMIFGRRYA